jgi:hypothetical protein
MLGDQGLHTLVVGLSKYFCMGNMVTPGDSQGALRASYVESLELLVVVTVSDPGFTAVKKCGDAGGLIDGDFGVEVEIPVVEDLSFLSFPESS